MDKHRAPFGCEMMSCTSSELLFMTSAASLKVTPSRLILFREIRRPPADKCHSGLLLEYSATKELIWISEPRHNPRLFEIELNEMSDSKTCWPSPFLTSPDAAVPVSRSIWHYRSNKDPQIKMAYSVLSDYHYSCVDTNETQLDIEMTLALFLLILHTNDLIYSRFA